MSERFLARWARKKAEAQSGSGEVVDPLLDPSDKPAQEVTQLENPPRIVEDALIPTEADLDAVEKTGDVSAFLVDQVPQALKNQAFKALFKNPKFNHVDMMDVYMDDYNNFVPLTTELRDKMSQIKQLLSRPDLQEQQDEAIEHTLLVEDSADSTSGQLADDVDTSLSTRPIDQESSTHDQLGQNDPSGL